MYGIHSYIYELTVIALTTLTKLTMKKALLLLLILAFACQKDVKLEKKLTLIEFTELKEKEILNSKLKTHVGKLFLSFQTNQDSLDFTKSAEKLVSEKILNFRKKKILFPLISRNNTSGFDVYFDVEPKFQNDKLKSIFLETHCPIYNTMYSNNYDPQSFYYEYLELLTKKYGNPILEFEDLESTRQAFWINNGIVINIWENYFLNTRTNDHTGEYIILTIAYTDLEYEKERIQNFRSQERKFEDNENFKKQKKSDSLRKMDSINEIAF